MSFGVTQPGVTTGFRTENCCDTEFCMHPRIITEAQTACLLKTAHSPVPTAGCVINYAVLYRPPESPRQPRDHKKKVPVVIDESADKHKPRFISAGEWAKKLSH